MNKQFVFGEVAMPQWFRDEIRKGRVKLVYEDDEWDTVDSTVVGAEIKTVTKKYNVEEGDMVIMSKNGIVVKKKEEKRQVLKDEKKE